MGCNFKKFTKYIQKNDGYHSKCYKKYTVYNISAYITEEEVESKISSVPAPLYAEASQVGFSNQYVCFVIKNEKKIKSRWLSLGSCEKFDVEISIREAANKLENENIKRKIGNYKYKEGHDFIALEVKYHHECKGKYLNKMRNTKSSSTLEQSMYHI